MKVLLTWLKASRIPAQSFIFPFLLLGQAFYFGQSKEFSITSFILIQIYGFFMHLYIVYTNDYADYETDKLNQTFTPFTGGSRVLVDNELSRSVLLKAGILSAFVCVVFGIILSIMAQNISIFLFVLVGILLLYNYSFDSVKMSYRGFGEILQVIGVGIILPIIGFLSQGGSLSGIPIHIILILLPAQLAMAVSTSLPDEISDKLSSKKTTVVILGAFLSRYLIVFMYSLSVFAVYIELGYINIYLFSAIITTTLIQILLNIFSKCSPGSKALFYFVLLSIITNILIAINVTYYYFNQMGFNSP